MELKFPVEFIEKLKTSPRPRVCVLTGAGISKESGVPTFRDNDGLWKKFRPEELASMEGFLKNPEMVWEWYSHRRKIIKEVVPNPGHYALTAMENIFPFFTLVTQNVDNLHHRAGGRHVLELHGNIERNLCLKCLKKFDDFGEIDEKVSVPRCPECQGQLRPDVVWFGEQLPGEIWKRALAAAETCQVFFSIGTSALVYPAAGLPLAAMEQGALLVEINPHETDLTPHCDFSFRGESGKILPALIDKLIFM